MRLVTAVKLSLALAGPVRKCVCSSAVVRMFIDQYRVATARVIDAASATFPDSYDTESLICGQTNAGAVLRQRISAVLCETATAGRYRCPTRKPGLPIDALAMLELGCALTAVQRGLAIPFQACMKHEALFTGDIG